MKRYPDWLIRWMNLPHDIRLGFRNLWYWLPVVWRDRHWDPEPLFAVMEHKLRAMARQVESEALHVGYEETVGQLREAAECCRRLQGELYPTGEHDRVDHFGRGWRLRGTSRDPALAHLVRLLRRQSFGWWT